MITGKTSTGFAFALPENKLQDMRILRALAATMKAPDEADPFAQLTALDLSLIHISEPTRPY